MKDWTIMVYLGADNNLGQEMIWALKDIYQAQSELDNKIKVVALFDGGGPARRFDPRQDRHVRSKELDNRNGEHEAGEAPVPDGVILDVSDQGLKSHRSRNHNSDCAVDSIEHTLKTFILDTIKEDENAAEHYMLVLSGHGSGVIGEFLPAQKRQFGLTIPTLKRVLRSVKRSLPAGRKIDILGLDACEMSMTEIAYEVREEVDFVIGAEGFQPNTGWPYDRVLKLFKPGSEPADICKDIVKNNIQFYLDYTTADLSVDTSAIGLGKEFEAIKRLTKALKGFTTTLGLKKEKNTEKRHCMEMDALQEELKTRENASAFADKDLVDAIVLARREAQAYKNEQFVDLWDFCDLLFDRLKRLESLLAPGPKEGQSKEQHQERLTLISNVKDACENIKDAIAPEKEGEVGLVISSAYTGAAFQHSHGVSIYFPWATLTDAAGIADVDHYQLLDFAKDTLWDEFIRLFNFATIRDRRKAHSQFPVRLSMLNRRTGLFTGVPGHRDPEVSSIERDPEVSSIERTNVGSVRIASMKNPPIDWCEYRFD